MNKSESNLMKEFIEAGRGSGDGPEDEHEGKEAEHVGSKYRPVLRPAVDRVQ